MAVVACECPFFVATSTWRPFFPRCTLFDLPTHRVPHFIVRLFHTGLAKRECVCVRVSAHQQLAGATAPGVDGLQRNVEPGPDDLPRECVRKRERERESERDGL